MAELTFGSLAIVTETQDKKTIERELQKLDRNLFIDFEADTQYGLIPLVRERISGPPYAHTVLRWQESDGRPKPICWAMVEQVKRQEGAAATSVQTAITANEQHREGLRKRAGDDYGAIKQEHDKRIRAAELDSLPPGWRPKNFNKK